MSQCPHCGKTLIITKAEDITAAKSVGRPTGDLAGAVTKSIAESVNEKIADTVQKVSQGTDAVLTSLSKLNQMANSTVSKDANEGLGHGWSGIMRQSLRRRDELVAKGYDSKELADEDPERLDKSRAASTLQNMIHGFLGRKSEGKS